MTNARGVYTCPKCHLSVAVEYGRSCTNCGYRGDWIQPGETHLYKCPAREDATAHCNCVDLTNAQEEA